MRALALPLLAFSLLTACADPPPPAAPRPAAAEHQTKAPPPPRYAELTTADCQTWADNFATKLKDATKRRIDECSAKVKAAGGTPSPDSAKDLDATNAEADRLHAVILDQCGQQVGAMYNVGDAACFMDAKKMEDWRQCPFQSMFFSDYKAVARNHQKMFDDRCQHELNKVAGNKSPSAG